MGQLGRLGLASFDPGAMVTGVRSSQGKANQVLTSPFRRAADNSQNGLISDVWDQLRICLFKSNFKY